MNQDQAKMFAEFQAFQAFVAAQTAPAAPVEATPAAPAAPKAEAKGDAIMVVHNKTSKGESMCNALLSKMPTVDDLKRSSNTFDALALAALGGHAWPEGLVKITPKGNLTVDTKSGIAPNYRSMIKKIAQISPQKRREAWAAYVDGLKTLHGITFNGLYKAIMKASRPEKIATPPLRDLIKMVIEEGGTAASKIKKISELIAEAEAKTPKAK
jgi:hypothetical protein